MQVINDSLLILFPAAGCSNNNYKNWNSKLDCDTFPIEYRGHWTRSNEPFYSDVEDMIEDIFHQVNDSYDMGEKNCIYLVTVWAQSWGGCFI
jgi:surfactin synthase thioesterase subunit